MLKLNLYFKNGYSRQLTTLIKHPKLQARFPLSLGTPSHGTLTTFTVSCGGQYQTARVPLAHRRRRVGPWRGCSREGCLQRIRRSLRLPVESSGFQGQPGICCT